MFERRPILGLILGLNVCVLIWRISVQEQALLDSGAAGGAFSASGTKAKQQQVSGTNNLYYKPQQTQHQLFQVEFVDLTKQQQQLQQHNPQQQKQQPQLHQYKQQLYAGKHLLSDKMLWNDSAQTDKVLTTHKKYKIPIEQDSGSRIVNNNSSDVYNDGDDGKDDLKIDLNVRVANLIIAPAFAQQQTTTTLKRPATMPTRSTAAAAAAHTLPEGDFSHLMDVQNFVHIMRQPGCAVDVEALILVHSAPHYHEKRRLIRTTWGGAILLGTPLRLIFLLGAVSNRTLQLELEQENKRHGDMIQGSFVDNYRNMTYKHVMALKWFLYNCAHAQILIKVDDDVFVNTPQLLKYLRNKDHAVTAISLDSAQSNFSASQNLFRRPQNLVFCEELIGARVRRSFRSKWRVSFNDYPDPYYPPYCPGYAIIYSADVVYRLYLAAQEHKYFWIDDVLITGILVQRLNANITTSAPYVLRSRTCKDLLNGKTDFDDVEFLFARHRLSPKQIQALWSAHLKSLKNITPTLPSAYALVTSASTRAASYGNHFRRFR